MEPTKRPGTTFLFALPESYRNPRVVVLADGRLLVADPDNPPLVVTPDGSTESITEWQAAELAQAVPSGSVSAPASPSI